MKIVILTLSLLLVISCIDKKSKQNKSDHPGSQTETIPKNTKRDGGRSTILETKTGKLFEVYEKQISSSISNISIHPKGFSEVNETILLKEIDPISDMFCSDLDQNNYDELYIISKSVGSGTYATIYGYASNNDKSISPIIIPEIAQSDLAPDAIFYGYRGHDSIYISSDYLNRKFPVYNKNDNNCCPTGGTRTIKYNLVAGEASWRLEVTD